MVTARPRVLGVVAVVVTLTWFYSHSLYRQGLITLALSHLDTQASITLSTPLTPYTDHIPSLVSEGALKSWGRRASMRDNLRSDKRYIFSPWSAGWNNQVMQAMNMILLAIMTDRIPILTPFVSQGPHVGVSGDKIAVGDIFDLSRLSAALGGLPIVEYRELKADDRTDATSQASADQREDWRTLSRRDHPNYTEGIYEEAPSEREQLGCWSYWGTTGKVSHNGGGFHLDLQHTPLPTEVFTQPNDPSKDVRPDTNKIAHLIRSQNNYHQPKSARDALEQYNMQAPTADPEEHIACVDFTFFFATHPEVEDVISEYRAGTGPWARVGTYMRYRTEWEGVAAEYARRAFGLSHGEEVPPYVALHIRRGDFKHVESLDIRHYAHAVSKVQQTLKERLGLIVPRVLVMTDETDPAWLPVPLLSPRVGMLIGRAEVKAYPGFYHMDHIKERTTEKYGVWHATVIDSVLLSSAAGMVGLRDSTMAILAYRRVIDWKGGVGKLIHFGYKIPDEYKYTPIA